MKLYKSIIYTMLLMGVLLSCTKDRGESPNGEVAELQLTLPSVSMRAGALFADKVEEEIKTVRIFVFSQKGNNIDAQKLFKADTEDFKNPFTMEAHVGTKDIYVVANEPSELTDQLEKVVFVSDLMKIMLPEKEDKLTTPLTMVGDTKNIELKAEGKTEATVTLTRVVAKITLDLKQATEEEAEVKILSASIDRLPKHSTLFPKDKGFTLEPSWTYKKTQEVELKNKADFKSYIADNTLYVYENLGSAQDSTSRAPRLTVTALYNGIEITYHAYINDDKATGATKHYCLERNHHYKLQGTITKLGEFSALLLSTKVLPWNVEELEKNFLEPKATSIDANIVNTDNVITKYKPLTFKVKIKASEGKTWRATVTNGLEFKVEIKQGDTIVAEGKVDETEYTVVVTPLKDPDTTKTRTTELFFTVDGKEIVLSGAGVSDRKTRIKISQKPHA
ncbi:fimbrial protein [Porphyromonas levii]|uniref:fimbrial protein n=1 Tax=Porphyromonas levii TaxID=28114 RepID=UPI001BA6776B|nr:fimbrial protein [Porphyromonas levii]